MTLDQAEGNVHLHAEVMIRLGADIGLPEPVMMEISLCGLDGAMNLDEFQEPLEMILDSETMVKRWRKEMIEHFPGKKLSHMALELTGWVQIARAAMAANEAERALNG